MKILLVSGPGISLKEPFDSGIEVFLFLFANQLIASGHQVDVVAHQVDHGSNFTLLNLFPKSTTDSPNIFRRILEASQFKRLDLERYDIVHYHMFYPHLLKAGINLKKTIFVTLHSPAEEKRAVTYKALIKRGDVIFVSISERVKNQWDVALGQETHLINNGINHNDWPRQNQEEKKYLLWSARINAKKNVHDAIKLANHMQLPLKIAGRIVDQQYFNEFVKPYLNEQIQYLGHVTQKALSGLTKHAIAYLATATWQEPFGLAALEMLSSGVPVVGYHTAVPPDWIHESVLKTNSHRWQDLIALVEKSQGICAESCQAFASTMSIENMTTQYVELYKSVLSGYSDARIGSTAKKRLSTIPNPS